MTAQRPHWLSFNRSIRRCLSLQISRAMHGCEMQQPEKAWYFLLCLSVHPGMCWAKKKRELSFTEAQCLAL